MVVPFALVTPASRGLSLALVQQLLKTTKLPVYATHRSKSDDEVRERILQPLRDVDESRLTLLQAELTDESSIQAAADKLAEHLPKDSYLHTGFFTAGVLYPEKQPSDLDAHNIAHTFQINVISHLLQIKHFSRFLPSARFKSSLDTPAKWVHVSARVGSISDNERGGWYSYRASKSALNQVIKTFDLQLKMKQTPAISVGVHPGTVKTDLSKGFWTTVAKDKLFEPEYAAEHLVSVVEKLKEDQRGRLWDWQGDEIHP